MPPMPSLPGVAVQKSTRRRTQKNQQTILKWGALAKTRALEQEFSYLSAQAGGR